MLSTDAFHALADSTRRSILDRLREEDGLSLTELAAPLSMTRQAVTKHVDVLIDADVVRVTWHGRQRRHHLQPEALEAVTAWLAPYAAAWDRRLARLARHLETPDKKKAGHR